MKLNALLAAVVVLSSIPVAASPALAGEALTSVPETAVRTFRLTTEPDLWQQNAQAIGAVERSGTVQKVTAPAVAASGERTGRPGLCHDAPFDAKLAATGFCWDEADDRSSSWNTKIGGWTPQGLTGSHDADNTDGTVDGRHLYVASWYRGKGPTQLDQMARISIVDHGPTTTTYGHVLLVRPTGSSFTAVTKVHADGAVWYGNRLFVANGRELQVYDMRHIWAMSALTDAVGVVGTASSADGHRWAMPMIGSYWTGATPDVACTVRTGSSPCLNSLSLDRTGADALISAEYTRPDAATGGRIIRWPLNHVAALPRADDGTGIGTATATSALSAPVRAMQGAATNGTDMFVSAQCPDDLEQELPSGHPDAWTCVYQAAPGDQPVVLTMAPRLTQNLSWSRFSGRLWGLNERINSAVGVRMVFSLKVPS